MTGWCQLWIYNYGLLVKPLYALTVTEQKHLEWNKEAEQAFEQLKKALMSAPALGLPDVASFLSGNTGEPVHHDCLETIEATYASRPDLKDSPIENGENWFTDGSSYVLNGNRHAGYAITTSQEVIESGPLPMNTSAQKAEIIALTRALELAQSKTVNIYTDTKYAFGVVHAHGAIWKERVVGSSTDRGTMPASVDLRSLVAATSASPSSLSGEEQGLGVPVRAPLATSERKQAADSM
ncbi:uncharacterized protein LOC121080435 [Falco naumanni]|uniref:uncharacterized protein LOC121080435 n=1 Tax=Falco naumanni TaxID=148594 RepID=UPI001ADE5512|nr:uncharacterized protein LOC121080435 [Falco naumanni]